MAPCSSQEYFSLQSAFRRPSALQPGTPWSSPTSGTRWHPLRTSMCPRTGPLSPVPNSAIGPSPLNRGNLERFGRELSREVKLPKFGRYCHILPRFRIEHREGIFWFFVHHNRSDYRLCGCIFPSLSRFKRLKRIGNQRWVPQIFLGQNDSPYLNAENICFGLAMFSLSGLQSSPGNGRGLQMAWIIAWWGCQGHMWFWCLMFGCPLIARHDEGWIIGYTTECLGRKWPVCFFPVLNEFDYWGSID